MGDTIDLSAAVAAAVRHWSRLPELASFAAARHGFGDSDGGFGVTYPGDLDEHDRGAGHAAIPGGHVEVYGHWGPPGGYSLIVLESLYLGVLAGILADAGLHQEAARVRAQAGDA